MKKLLLAAALLALGAAGCVQTRVETTIDPTGAGTLDMTLSFSPGVVEALQELQSTAGAEAAGEMPDLGTLDRARLEESCRMAGVALTRYEKSAVNGREQTRVSLSFRKLDDLGGALNQPGEVGGALRLVKLPSGDYMLGAVDLPREKTSSSADAKRLADPAAPEGTRPQGSTSGGGATAGSAAGTAPAAAADDAGAGDAAAEDEAVQRSMAALGKLMASAGELEIVLRITVPGDVITHNAMRVEGRTLIWEINSANMMTAGASLKPEIVFSGKGVDIDAPVWKGAVPASKP